MHWARTTRRLSSVTVRALHPLAVFRGRVRGVRPVHPRPPGAKARSSRATPVAKGSAIPVGARGPRLRLPTGVGRGSSGLRGAPSRLGFLLPFPHQTRPISVR